MELVGVQLDIAWEDREANFTRSRALLDAVRLSRGAVVALPEMFGSGFSMNVGRVAEDEGGETERFLAEMAKRLGIYLVGGVAIKTEEPPGAAIHGRVTRATNQAVVFSPGGACVTRYSKIHPYTPGKEKEHFIGGDKIVTFTPTASSPCHPVTLSPCHPPTVAPFVCYDLRFPEIFRAGMQRGANVFVVIANWPTARVEHWMTLLRARAIENQAYVLGVNRCGNDPYLPYPGRSLIVDFRGNVLADAGDREGVIRAEIDLDALRQYRRELPFLTDAKRDLSALFD